MTRDVLVGLVSDSHDNIPAVDLAVGFFRDASPDLVLHLGDITAAQTVARFEGLRTLFVQGNNDEPRRLDAALQRHGFAPLVMDIELELAGVKVAAHHGHQRPRLSAEPDVLLHGHTHSRRATLLGRTLVVNPGALHRVAQRTIAMLELPSKRVRSFEVRSDRVVELPS